MTGGLDPTEEYDGSITVRLLADDADNETVRCASYEEAVDVVRERADATTVAKIVDRDGDVVFTSSEMDVDVWESEWVHAKRRLSADVEAHECPYDSVSCFADDLCVRCKMDAVQERY